VGFELPKMKFSTRAPRSPAPFAVVVLCVLGCGQASDTRETAAAIAPPRDSPREVPTTGRWKRVKSLDTAQLQEIAALDAIGYLDGSSPAEALTGVITSDRGRSAPGLNFYFSGHAPEAFLMDAGGRVLHSWTTDFELTWKRKRTEKNRPKVFWRHAELLPNGDLLAIHEGLGPIRIDRNSELLWAVENHAHHDVDVADNGDIYVLTRVPRVIPRIHPTRFILEDFISILSPDGVEKRRISVIEALQRSEFRHHLQRVEPAGDIFHTNAIELFDGSLAHRSPLFARGNVLISLRNIHLLAIVDTRTGKVVWGLTGVWRRQHKPTLLESGHILLFDNKGNSGTSRVLEIDPLTGEAVWSYSGSESRPLYSKLIGSNQRLRNHNTLITESERGRAIEVTPSGDIVWEFLSPYRAGEDDEWVATLFELVRLEDASEWSWLGAGD
jgi:hypothetical protein